MQPALGVSVKLLRTVIMSNRLHPLHQVIYAIS